MTNVKGIRSLLFGLAVFGFAGAAYAQQRPIEHRIRDVQSAVPTAGSTVTQTPVITNHGGPIIPTPTAYIIWYGNWNQSNGSDTPAGQQIVRDFLFGLNGSNYYLINSSYSSSNGSVTGGITHDPVADEYTDTGSQGTRLSDSKVQAVVSNAISGGHLPKDTSGLYIVLSSSNVAENSGFCTRYCGWHTKGTIAGSDIKYAFVGNANRCLSACAAQSTGPNGNAGVDGTVSVLAHELEESTTDPDLNAWYDANGAENGDKCAWTFGQNLSVAANGAYYNMTLATSTGGSRNYLVQRNLDSSSACYVDYVKKSQ
jgi:hypothetical protein